MEDSRGCYTNLEITSYIGNAKRTISLHYLEVFKLKDSFLKGMMKKMKRYEEPIMEVTHFGVTNIIRTSDETLPGLGGGGTGGDVRPASGDDWVR